ncbi:MAG: plasmid pRiA4b ORF-3 family protein [Leptospirales bacterium]|nr:plasmid pRiA4b ORF-3 family protein [Leptospirales bacterium]
MAKSLVLSVSVEAGCYRHIQISEGATLFDLHEIILESFDFIDDHMHTFFMNNRAWDKSEEYICPNDEAEFGDLKGFSDKAKLSKFRLKKDSKFLYIFDFGDEWRFKIKVLKLVDEVTKEPIVLKSVGEISQYGYYDEDYDDD